MATTKSTNEQKRMAYIDLLKAAQAFLVSFEMCKVKPTDSMIEENVAQIVLLKAAVQTCEHLMGGK